MFMEYVYDGLARAVGVLFISGIVFGIYRVSLRFSNEKEPIKSRWQYIFTVLKWIIIVAVVALVMSGMGGGCDDFGDCTEPSSTPQAETWAYLFMLILVPSMFGLHRGLKIQNKNENTK